MSAARRPVALVTGGAVRVGRAVCMALARAGCDVSFTYRSNAERARELGVELRGMGAAGEARELELGDPGALEAFCAAWRASGRGLDVLVHNASVYSPTPLAELTAERAMQDYAVNAVAPLLLTRGLSAPLSASAMDGGGAVVAMCDIHAMGRPRRGFSSYSMSKAALAEMVRSLAVELAPRVRVNGVAPGVVAFPESGYESDPEMQERYLRRVPLARSGTVDDAAVAVRWLALEATYTTGTIVRVDGGRWLS